MSYLTKKIENSIAYQCAKHSATKRKSFLNFLKKNWKTIKPKRRQTRIEDDFYIEISFNDSSCMLIPKNHSNEILEKHTYIIKGNSIIATNFELSFFIKVNRLKLREINKEEEELYRKEKFHEKKDGDFYTIFPFSRTEGYIYGNTEEEKRKTKWGLFLMTEPRKCTADVPSFSWTEYAPVLKKELKWDEISYELRGYLKEWSLEDDKLYRIGVYASYGKGYYAANTRCRASSINSAVAR